jgi:PAS domain S-box-containing protein
MPVADSPIDEPAGAPDAEPVRAAVEAPHHEAAETPEPATIAEADVAPGQPEPEIVDEAPIEATEFQVADAPAHATPAAIDEAALAVEIAAADVAPEEAAHRAPEPVPGDGSADVVEAILDEPLEEGAPAAEHEHEHEHEPEPEPEPVALVEAPADAPPPDAANDDAPAEPPAFSDLSTRADGAFANAWSARVATDVDAPAAEPVEPAPEAAPATPAPEVAAPVTEAPPAPAPRPSPAASGAMLKLSAAERNAFREIARALGARFDDESEPEAVPEPAVEPPAPAAAPALPAVEPSATQVLARLPIGVLVHRGESLIYANRALLDMLGYDDAPGLIADGGLMRLFKGRAGLLARAEVDTPAPVPVVTRSGEAVPAEIRHVAVDWDDEPAALMLVRRVPDGDPAFRLKGVEADLRVREGRVRELSSILDTATDGVVVVDDVGRVLSLNRSAEALFGFEQNEVVGEPFTALIAPESHVAALDYLEGLRANGVASLLNDGREVLGRVRQGGVIPLFMTMGRVSDGLERKFCAVLRDITAFKKAEGELLAAKRAAEASSAHKSDFLAKISHEVRTPLNAIIGFAEVMLEERFGPVGNDRYRDYLRDIHASGEHVISLVNDLLDLAKVEAGRMEMAFTSVSLNELVTSCVSIMQPEAARARIVLRTSFSGKLPPVVADERSVRQIVLNLLSNAVKFTDAGGQVIVSTALTDRGEVAFRVRDTGIGMSDDEIEAALEPFRQLATARRGGGTGLGLPLTKALVEANRGMLQISSTKSEGTLVEVVFPPTRVLAE